MLELGVRDLVLWVRQQSAGRIFKVRFQKRTGDKGIREMVCRIGVKKHLAGGEKSFDDDEYKLLTVWDMQRNGYRSIPTDGIISARLDGHEYSIIQGVEV
jgi:hypothetical protein